MGDAVPTKIVRVFSMKAAVPLVGTVANIFK